MKITEAKPRDLLVQQDKFLISQDVNWTQEFTGFDQPVRYGILNEEKEIIGRVSEDSGSGIQRFFFGAHRALNIDIQLGEDFFKLRRDSTWFLSDASISDVQGIDMGRIQRRFRWFTTHYDLIDSGGNIFASIDRPWWGFWTFKVIDPYQRIAAHVQKQINNLMKAAFTSADDYVVTFLHRALDSSQRAIVIAACIVIDFDFFEDKSSKRRFSLGAFLPFKIDGKDGI
jgi:uncharacterized protein YxjI